ncbi:hypothetical protein SERLA73DRAFT_187263 [Serpula lacrymans var. lacrymans S7.3]|uniref:Peptidase M24 domain-containing protein n=2 Tax=Serpula lacrymans var. lacrymans TaxID=341189 RepID=F8Q8T3_SERL3|nr:uncharacterized protein SERLADRAFT_476705 [Serpula lacrymans var. lacrymans S7.9]EGN94988.1 hypothetical protein SERLA73DRAFT_187263 [Serpula lacrymans var. lacrymans S7.3]EGO20481.1 hypothetical protein SERLADRAFT_476705 [Serpula lacrymans var. lacrymans S7.9]
MRFSSTRPFTSLRNQRLGYIHQYIHPRRLSSLHQQSESSPGQDFGDYSIILPPEPFIWGVSHITPRNVPASIRHPSYATDPELSRFCLEPDSWKEQFHGDGRIQLGGEEEECLRRAAHLARDVLGYAGSLVRSGITTNAIDAAVHEYILSRGAYPSPLLYAGFPRSCCTSVNNVVVHGIPDDRPLESGDIVNIDITVYLNGYHGDTSMTFEVGNVDSQGQALIRQTTLALEAGIRMCGPGQPFSGIGKAIWECVNGVRSVQDPHDISSGDLDKSSTSYLSSSPEQTYSICQAFSGHGIGRDFHRTPWIYHTPNEEPGVMRSGHCFTIEPAIIQGPNASTWIFPDGWTASTENCARSAQAEHMILITEDGAEVLTR